MLALAQVVGGLRGGLSDSAVLAILTLAGAMGLHLYLRHAGYAAKQCAWSSTRYVLHHAAASARKRACPTSGVR